MSSRCWRLTTLVGDQPDDAVPFWLSMEVLTGAETAPFEYAGDWTCATILVDNPMDSPIEAPGTWAATRPTPASTAAPSSPR